MMTSFDDNYQNALGQAIVFSVSFSFVTNRSCVTQICITKIAAKCMLVVVVKWCHHADVLLYSPCTQSYNSHVTGVCLLPSQSASGKHNQEKAHIPLRTSKMCLSCLIIIQSCYFDYRINKPFICSRCVICVSCSVHLNSTYHVREGSWSFLS